MNCHETFLNELSGLINVFGFNFWVIEVMCSFRVFRDSDKQGAGGGDIQIGDKMPGPGILKETPLRVLPESIGPLDRSRVRLAINETGNSIARVALSEYSVKRGYDPEVVPLINKAIGELRDLGRQFMLVENDPPAQGEVATALRSKIAKYFSPDQAVHLSSSTSPVVFHI